MGTTTLKYSVWSLSAIIVFILLLEFCNKPIIRRGIVKSSDTTIVVKHDTVVKVDTLTKVGATKYYPKVVFRDIHDTVYTVYKDSLIDDTVNIYFEGKALDMRYSKLKYVALIPNKTIYKDSIITINNKTEIHDTIFKKTIGYSLSGGLHTRVSNSSYDVGPIATFNTPIGGIGYEYGILSKSHQVFITIPLIKPKR